MTSIVTVQDLVEELEGVMDGEVTVIIEGDRKDYQIQRVLQRDLSSARPRVVLICAENSNQ